MKDYNTAMIRLILLLALVGLLTYVVGLYAVGWDIQLDSHAQSVLAQKKAIATIAFALGLIVLIVVFPRRKPTGQTHRQQAGNWPQSPP